MDTDNPFERVLERLREKGWRKKAFGTADGPNCIRGAAEQIGLDPWKVVAVLRPIINDQYSDRLQRDRGKETVATFNDDPDTTFEDVERVLEKAAVKWEEERVLRDE